MTDIKKRLVGGLEMNGAQLEEQWVCNPLTVSSEWQFHDMERWGGHNCVMTGVIQMMNINIGLH